MSVSFPSASGGASYDPNTYLTNPLAAIPDPTDTVVDPTNVGSPAAPAASTASTLSTSSGGTATTGTTGSTAPTTPSATTATAIQQQYENFNAYNTEALLTYTFGGSTALDQPAEPFGSQALINATTQATLGVLAQATSLQDQQNAASAEAIQTQLANAQTANVAALNNLDAPQLNSALSDGTGTTVDTTA